MILAFDIGTSALKGALFGPDGAPSDRAETPLALVAHADPLWHESDARDWVAGVKRVVSRLAPSRSAPIEAVVVSGNGPTLVPVAADGSPVANALSWMDRRAVGEAAAIARMTGNPSDPTFFLPKAYWFFRNRPDEYDRTRFFFSCPEYVAYVLTGRPATFLPTPEYVRYFWEERLIGDLGMDAGKFPPFLEPGRILGAVSAAGEDATGIPAGIPVASAGPDFIVSLLGTATVAPGRACIRAGTSEGINLCSPVPVRDRRLLCVTHIAAGNYNVSGMISTSGKALEWFKDATGRAGESYERIFEEMERVPPGARRLLFLPYLAGERAPLWDPCARGAFIGLTLNHGIAEMTRAVAESAAFAIRDVIGTMEENGLVVRDLRITGAPSRSRLWNQIKADVTGRRILLPEARDAELVGDACLALCALGRYGSPAAASEAVVRIGAVFEPDAGRGAMYDEMFGLYRRSYEGLQSVFHDLSAPRSAS